MRPGPRVLAAASLAVAAAAWLAWLNACATPLRIEPVERRCGPPVTDPDLELARTFAPWLYHEVHARGGRQDVPAPIDFDGNLDGDDNWETFPRCELVPTVYYAHLETATHHFLCYHVFHPRDWEPFDLGLNLTHEGDGENLAVVVDKASLRPVLLFTQAHYRGGAYGGADFAGGDRALRGPFVCIDDAGRPSAEATHAAVFVESKGHGLYGALGRGSRVSIEPDGRARFERQGLVFRPALPDEPVGEPALDAPAPVPYRLESTLAKLWPGVRDGSLVGPGRAFDKTVPYADARVALDLPKFHAATASAARWAPRAASRPSRSTSTGRRARWGRSSSTPRRATRASSARPPSGRSTTSRIRSRHADLVARA